MTSQDQYVEFVNARASALLRTAILLTAGDRARAEDLVETSLVRAYAKRRVRTPIATEVDARRSLVRAVTRGRDDGGRRIDGHDDRNSSPLTILDALRTLPPRQRATVVLRYYDDYSEAQVADALGSAASTVRRHSTRALETLGTRWAAENTLQTSMAAAADLVRAEPELVTRVVEESRSAQHRRRRNWWLTGCAAAMIALVGGGLVFYDESDDSPPRPDPPTPFLQVDPIAWADQLPQGPPVRLAYVGDRAIHLPGRPAPLPHDAGRPVGKTTAGWLVTVNRAARPSTGGLPARLGYGLVSANGTIEPLPRDPYDGSFVLEALSPDGKLFAMGGALIDLAQGRVVGRTPPNAFYSTGWMPIGLLYVGGPNESGWLWRPGSPPIALPDRIWDTAATAPIGLASSGDDCMNVVRLTADGDVSVIYKGCASGASSPISLSPDGSHALTADFDVLDVDEGTITRYDLPTSGIAGQLGWEDNDHFVLPLESQETATRDRVVFVRCSIAMHECERAGPEFTKPVSEQVLVA